MHKIEYVIKKYGFEAVQVMNTRLYKCIRKKKKSFNTFLYYVKLHFFFVLPFFFFPLPFF